MTDGNITVIISFRSTCPLRIIHDLFMIYSWLIHDFFVFFTARGTAEDLPWVAVIHWLFWATSLFVCCGTVVPHRNSTTCLPGDCCAAGVLAGGAAERCMLSPWHPSPPQSHAVFWLPSRDPGSQNARRGIKPLGCYSTQTQSTQLVGFKTAEHTLHTDNAAISLLYHVLFTVTFIHTFVFPFHL